jgi:two-component system response regulator MtrA
MSTGGDTGRILIVDDEVNIRAGLRDVLVRDGHSVTEAGSGEEALEILETSDYDVAIVDIRMPEMSGVELLELIRTRWPHVAVVMLTGHGTMETAMVAVKAGAHDYLLKPARAEAIRGTLSTAFAASRRHQVEAQLLESMRSGLKLLDGAGDEAVVEAPTNGDTHRLAVGDLHIDLRAHEVRRDGIPVGLSPTEFKLLVALASRPGEAIDYGDLVQESMGYEAEPWEAKELIKRHVYALRHKIETDPAAPEYVVNVRGIGYRLAAPD